MPYLLKNLTDGSLFYLLNKSEFVLGRKDCDFLIQSDQSISRKHAIIRLRDGKVTVEDCGAKYKTLFKNENLTPNVEVQLQLNDEIQFGVIKSKYRLEQYKVVTTGTQLSSEQKTQVKSDLLKIEGQYVDNWTTDCTHLTAEQITLTIKVLHAILDEKPIVKPSYWTQFAENSKKNIAPPNINASYKPPIAEILLNNIELQNNPRRRRLFDGKQFVFAKEKNKKQMEDVIKKAGGTSISWEKKPMPLEDIKNSPKEILIMQSPDVVDDSNLNEVIKVFSKQGKRTIPVQEIAMSIVLCSCEKDCNPSFNRVEQVFPLARPTEPTQNNAIVPETQSECFSMEDYKKVDNKQQLIIPGTLESEIEVSLPIKNVNINVASSSKIDYVSGKEESDKQLSKRVNVDHLTGNPIKKAKLDISGNETKTVKQEKRDFLSKSTKQQKRSIEECTSLNDSSNDVKPNPFSFLNENKKCKSKENSDSKNNNPFKLLQKPSNNVPVVNEENPFKLSLGKKKRGIDDSSNVSASKKKKKDNAKDKIFSSTVIENDLNKSANFSKISKINYSDMNSTWFSKKTKMDINENIDNNLDTEMQKFIDQFKDTVIVEIMTTFNIKPKKFVDEINENKCNGKPNFKRFKKVMPLRPQKTVIERDNLKAVGPGEITGINDSRREFHVSDDEADETLKTKKKTPKRFFI